MNQFEEIWKGREGGGRGVNESLGASQEEYVP